MDIIVNIKHMGKRKNSVDEYTMTLENTPRIVGDLLEEMVKVSVLEYTQRMENSKLIQALSKEEIEDKAVTGKVGFGVNYGEKSPKLDLAIGNAKESFTDGIVVVFFGDKQVEELNEELIWEDNIKITIIRMTMLTGRLW